MKILVTGGAGYIGSHTVVELYNAGFEPIIVDNFDNSNRQVLRGLEVILGFSPTCYEFDCNNAKHLGDILEKESIEGVIHFAAYKAVGESVANPLKYYSNNLNSTIVLLQQMMEKEVKNIIFSSSCTVYGEPTSIPVTENTPRQAATSPYGNTKVMCEDILRDTAAVSPLAVIALRYFNPVGAHESALIGELPNGVPNNLVPYITQTAAGIRQKLTVHGSDYDTPDGTNIRDYVHVVDLAKAHVAAMKFLQNNQKTSFYDTFNIGTGQGNSVLEIVKTFERVNDLKLNYELGPRRPGDVVQIYGSVDKANEVLGWKTEKTLEDSLRDSWNWQKQLAK
jgi:UDP-glucose 4-epimerase